MMMVCFYLGRNMINSQNSIEKWELIPKIHTKFVNILAEKRDNRRNLEAKLFFYATISINEHILNCLNKESSINGLG